MPSAQAAARAVHFLTPIVSWSRYRSGALKNFVRDYWIWIVLPALAVLVTILVLYATVEGRGGGGVYPI